MLNQAVEHNVAAFSELSFAVRRRECYAEAILLRVTALI